MTVRERPAVKRPVKAKLRPSDGPLWAVVEKHSIARLEKRLAELKAKAGK